MATAVLNGNRLENWRVIFKVANNKIGGQHFGSRLLWLPDETLLVSIGDGGNPPVRLAGDWIRKQAQNRTRHLGKILRMKDALNDILVRHTGKSLDDVQKDTDRDNFMSGAEAKSYGIVDHVITDRDDLDQISESEE